MIADHPADVGAQGMPYAGDVLPLCTVVGEEGVDLGGALGRESRVDQRVKVAGIAGQGPPVHGDHIKVT